MPLIFFDTEFTELGLDPRLISIGLVSESGEQRFYAELTDTYSIRDCSDFTRQVVIPLLEGGENRLSVAETARDLSNWLRHFASPVQLATDSLAWDWPWIHELFDAPGSWPENLTKSPLILQQTPEFLQALESAYSSGLRRHHALDDAEANRIA